MKLIVISYPESLPDEARQINRLFQHGLEHFHLRKPQWETARAEQLILQIEKQYYSRIVIHNHLHLAEKYGLAGIHFSASTKTFMEQWAQFTGSKSISCHSMEELETLPAGIDYAFLSPVFNSISKKGYPGMQNLQIVGTFLKTYSKCSVFALGGIDAKNTDICRQMGFNGIAVLGFLWQDGASAKRSMDNFIKIQKICQATDPT